MIFNRNNYAYIDSGVLYVKNLFDQTDQMVDIVGTKELIAFEYNNADKLFVFNDYSMLAQCVTIEQVENPIPCSNPQFSSIRVYRTGDVTPQYVNENYDFWGQKPDICDFKVFENSLNFLTTKTDQFSAICHKYNGSEYPIESKCVSAQYWFTMPLGTLNCSSIEYNIIPLKNHLGMDYEAGNRCYTKFNYEQDEISLIYEVEELPFDLDGPFLLPDYYKSQSLSSITFQNGTTSLYQNNADLFVSYDTSACAWLSADCVWIDTETQKPSDIVLEPGAIYEYKKISTSDYTSNVESFSAQVTICFDYFSGGYVEPLSELSLSPV